VDRQHQPPGRAGRVNLSGELAPYSGTVARWQADASLAPLHPLLTGLATLAGAPSDKLAGCWDKLGPHTLAAPAAFNLRASYPTGFGPGMQAVKPSELTSPDGTHYAAFFANGLETAATVYIAVDHDKDGIYEEVLPTELLHYFTPNARGEEIKDPAQANHFVLTSSNGDALTVLYQQAKVIPGEEPSPWEDSQPATATVHVAELRSDSDGEGLSDISEKLLYLDPKKVDTDGDGVDDLHDPAPNVDASKMGRDERGIARALQYFFAWSEGGHDQWWGDASYQPSGNPWQARYIYVSGAGPVAFTASPGTYCIWRPASEESSQRQNLPASFVSGDTTVSVSLSTSSFQPGAEASVSISFHGVGYAVDMKLVNGELYPVKASMTWIS
jgi:hypothetical protein